MKIGILGDIHANLEALNTCLKALVKDEGCDYVMATGDIVGYGPQPKECIERLMELEIPSVRGNHDEYTMEDVPLLTINQQAKVVIEWTRSQLDPEHIQYLRELPEIIDAKIFSIVHASNSRAPRWTYVLDEKTAKTNFHNQNHPICFNGHTHLPLIISCDPDANINMRKLENTVLEREYKYLINAGSVGQPRDTDPRACTITYDTETRELKVIRLEYDMKKIQRLMKEKGFPERLITRLEEGR